MSSNLRRHIRYPEDIFTVQAEIYSTYHMTNPTRFYNREDRWEVPHELFRDREIEMAPYYVTAQLPDSRSPEFLLILPMSVAGKNQMAGWLAGLSDGDNYGKFVAGALAQPLPQAVAERARQHLLETLAAMTGSELRPGRLGP
jgi:uncharacterized protein